MCICPNTERIYPLIHMDCGMNGISESCRDTGDDFEDREDSNLKSPR